VTREKPRYKVRNAKGKLIADPHTYKPRPGELRVRGADRVAMLDHRRLSLAHNYYGTGRGSGFC
jgi:hypothetical protein